MIALEFHDRNKNPASHRSTALANVAYKRSWRDIFRGTLRILTKKEKLGRGGLLKLPQLWKSKSVAFGSFFLMISTSCLKKPSLKTLRLFHSSNRPGGDRSAFSLESRFIRSDQQCSSCLTEAIHFGNDLYSSVASLRPLDAFPRNGWSLSIGIPGGLRRNTHTG